MLRIIADIGRNLNNVELKVHSKCEDEFAEIYNDAEDKLLLGRQLKQRLKFLDDEIEIFWMKTDWFGKLKSNKKFDKIIIKNKQNVRIIFYLLNDNGHCVILLNAFKEKSGKEGASKEYDKASEVCENRLGEVLKK